MTQTSRPTRRDVISMADEDRVNDVVLGAVLGLWNVVNNLTRLRPSRRDRYGSRAVLKMLRIVTAQVLALIPIR